ncbi:hypothetical protein Syn19_156 [Synechococcus phage Syn19]|uniref:Uncharacterized protein n=1 Tax=Synechococcus phage Syn19 TaxID=445684 RepID=E3SQC1_9CAUD|nr:hypothetical protein Syn19_156 [Synechococcus phage Syn19]ADO99401.1 hypothetical protein Syn19_156 [Synechococcus phage Syn19]
MRDRYKRNIRYYETGFTTRLFLYNLLNTIGCLRGPHNKTRL